MRNFIKDSESQKLNLKAFAIATLMPIGIMFCAMLLKPMWRDEYWTLFFSDSFLSINELRTMRWRDEVHPPLYYFALNFWQKIFPSVFGMRLFSIFAIGLTSLLLFLSVAEKDKRHLITFILMFLGSYWVVYFSAEVRPYVLLFCFICLSVFLVPKMLGDKVRVSFYLAWAVLGALMSMTHYFGALWFACVSFIVGVDCLFLGKRYQFFYIGLTAFIGLIPVVLWLLWSLPAMDLSDEISDRSFYESFSYAMTQYTRGLLAKTIGSNPLVAIIGFSGVVSAFSLRHSIDRVLLWSVILTSGLAFVLHFSFVELIKERAFIVIMPAILFIFARELSSRETVMMRYVPLVTVLMPILFLGEYFKNREKIPQMQELLLTHANLCNGEPILAYYRPSLQDGFYEMATDMIVKLDKNGRVFRPVIWDAREHRLLPESDCPVKAVGVLMAKSNKADLEDARNLLTKAGVNLENLEEHRFGKGRNIVWTTR